MKIDLSALDLERFYANQKHITGLGDFVLVTPHKAMWDWNPGEEHLRSLLCRLDGTVVSAGFPKFFNFGERGDSDKKVIEGMKLGVTKFPEKVDGSLIIRSVIDGQVHFRTRGSELIASDMRDNVMTLIREKYPELLSVDFNRHNSSFLMEYVSPSNQIVVRYSEPELVALGWIDFGGDQLSFIPDDSVSFLRQLTMFTVAESVDAFSVKKFVSQFTEEEGIVTWTSTPGEPTHLCKFKSAWYLRLHALRSQATPRYLKEFCYFNGVTNIEQLKEAFFKEGFDWEIVSYIEPLFNELRTYSDVVDKKIDKIKAEVISRGLHLLPERKDKAIAVTKLSEELEVPEMFAIMLKTALGEHDAVNELCDAMRLDMGLVQFRAFKKKGVEKLGAGKVIDDE